MKPQSMLRVSVMLLALLIHSAASRHIMMLPAPPVTSLPSRALLQAAPKAVDNDTITKPTGLNNMTGHPQTQAAPLQSSPIVVVKSGPAQPHVPVSVSGNGKIGPLTFGALAGIASATMVAALGLCVVLSCWCHRRRGKVEDTADAKGFDLPKAVTVGEDSIKSGSSFNGSPDHRQADAQLAPSTGQGK